MWLLVVIISLSFTYLNVIFYEDSSVEQETHYEIANVNLFYDDIAYVLQNTKKENLLRLAN